MNWNYRVAVNVDDDCYDLVECYYNTDGDVISWCAASVGGWENKEDIRGTLELMLKAFDKEPVKLEDDWVREYE